MPESKERVSTDADRRLLSGTIIGGRIRIEELLGEGATAAVYRANLLSISKTVAVKIIHSHLLGSSVAVERFQREARAISAISHQNLARILSVGHDERYGHYMVLEFIDGIPLSTLILESKLTAKQAVSIAKQICRALTVVHSAGLVHRDIKPHNIMIVRSESPDDTTELIAKIVDFGVVSMNTSSEQSGGGAELTRTGSLVGSPAYMSPEQCTGKVVDARADIYSLGCVLFELLTGRTPFDGTSEYEVMSKHLHNSVTKLNFPAGVPQELRKLVLSTLQKNPDKRPESALRLLQALEDIAWTEELVVPKKRIVVVSALSALLVLLVAGAFFYFWNEDSRQRDTYVAYVAGFPPTVEQLRAQTDEQKVETYAKWLTQHNDASPEARGLTRAYMTLCLTELRKYEESRKYAEEAFEGLMLSKSTLLNAPGQTEKIEKIAHGLTLIYPFIERSEARADLEKAVDRLDPRHDARRALLRAKMYGMLTSLVDVNSQDARLSNLFKAQLAMLKEGNAPGRDIVNCECAAASSLRREGNIEAAGKMLDLCLQELKGLNTNYPGLLRNIAQELYEQQRFREAKEMAARSVSAHLESGIKEGLASAVTWHARALTALDEGQTAFENLKKTFSEFDPKERSREQWQLVGAMAEADARAHLGRFEEVSAAQKVLLRQSFKSSVDVENAITLSGLAAQFYITDGLPQSAARLIEPIADTVTTSEPGVLSQVAADRYVLIGDLLSLPNAKVSSTEFLQAVLEKIKDSHNPATVIGVKIRLCKAYLDSSDVAKATSIADQLTLLDLAFEKRLPLLAMQAFASAAMAYESVSLLDDAEKQYDRATKVIFESGPGTDMRTQLLSVLGLARVKMRKKMWKEADTLLKLADRPSTTAGQDLRALCLQLQARMRAHKGDWREACYAYEEYLQIAPEHNDEYFGAVDEYCNVLKRSGDTDSIRKIKQRLEDELKHRPAVKS